MAPAVLGFGWHAPAAPGLPGWDAGPSARARPGRVAGRLPPCGGPARPRHLPGRPVPAAAAVPPPHPTQARGDHTVTTLEAKAGQDARTCAGPDCDVPLK